MDDQTKPTTARTGFVLEAIEEPSFPASKDDFWQFPPALAGRLRRVNEQRAP